MEKESKVAIGEVAKLIGISIRTLQYYDTIGVLPVNKDSSNGKRYYNENDLFKLQQIMFYKSMGMKLSNIKGIIQDTDDNLEIKKVLLKQKSTLSRSLNNLKSNIAFLEIGLDMLDTNKKLPLEQIVQLLVRVNINTIFEYSNVEFNNEVMQVLVTEDFSDADVIELYWDWKKLILDASCKVMTGVDPTSEEGQSFAKKWLDMVNKITRQNEELLKAHKSSYENRDLWPEEDRRLMDFSNNFIDEAVKLYLIKQEVL